MSVVSNPLIGNARQSMGGATFSRWKGIQVLKNKATVVANPKTPAQIAQRSAFTQTVAYFRSNAAAIRAGYKKLAVKQSEFNAFASEAIKNAFDLSAPPLATFDPALLFISRGTIEATNATLVTADRSANTIVATFPITTDGVGQGAGDTAILSAFNVTKNESAGNATSAARSSGTASIPMPASWAVADTLRVYLGFSNPTSNESSDSSNSAATIVA